MTIDDKLISTLLTPLSARLAGSHSPSTYLSTQKLGSETNDPPKHAASINYEEFKDGQQQKICKLLRNMLELHAAVRHFHQSKQK